MKYIRTRDGIWLNGGKFGSPRKGIVGKKHEYDFGFCFDKKDILKQSDTIEELCDEFVLFKDNKPYAIVPNKGHNSELAKDVWKDYRGAIWTDKGLMYVAKMNENGEFELL